MRESTIGSLAASFSAKAACPAASREPWRLGQFQLLLNQGKDLGTGKLKEIKDEEKRGTIPFIVSQPTTLISIFKES